MNVLENIRKRLTLLKEEDELVLVLVEVEIKLDGDITKKSSLLF